MYKSRFFLPGLIVIVISFAIAAVVIASDKAMADDSCDHVWSEWTVDWDADCNMEGQESRYCELCWEEETRTIPKTNHEWGDWEVLIEPSCDSKGEKYKTCSICYEEVSKSIPKTPHKWGKWKVVRKPTFHKKGRKKRDCKRCYSSQYKTVPKRKLTHGEKNAIGIVTKFLKAARKYDKKKMGILYAKISKGKWYPNDNMEWLPKKYNKKIKWKFKNISGNSRRKTVLMKVTYPDFSAKIRNAFFYAGKESYKRWGIKNNSYIQKQFLYKFAKKCRETAGKGKVKCSRKLIRFNMVKTKKGWRIKTNTKENAEIITCRYNKGIEDGKEKYSSWLMIMYLINR